MGRERFDLKSHPRQHPIQSHYRAKNRTTCRSAAIVALLFSIVDGDADAIVDAVRRNVDAGTGATTLAISGVDRELTKLLPDARLGPLIRRLSLFAGRDMVGAE